MEDEFGRTILTLTDENGEEFELELLGTVEDRGVTYYAVCEPEDEDSEDEEEIGYGILKVVKENGEELLEAVEDEEELNRVDALFLALEEDDEEPDDGE